VVARIDDVKSMVGRTKCDAARTLDVGPNAPPKCSGQIKLEYTTEYRIGYVHAGVAHSNAHRAAKPLPICFQNPHMGSARKIDDM
jgi:hypothetical protein